jgi:inhibitor of KinA
MRYGISNSYHFFPLGDSGVLIDFGNEIDTTINQQVLTLFELLQTAHLPWITDLVPAYSSLAVFYDCRRLATPSKKEPIHYEQAVKQLQPFLQTVANCLSKLRRQLRIPVCYETMHAPDLEGVAKQSGLSVEEVIGLHTSAAYQVYMIGFLPGFAYMGEVPERIAVPRRSEPRSKVPAGSVGIAGRQTGIYPFDSPGGWQLIGKTPVSLFQKKETSPTLFQPADEVIFYPITANEFTHYKGGAV